jgi:hypothetical protein
MVSQLVKKGVFGVQDPGAFGGRLTTHAQYGGVYSRLQVVVLTMTATWAADSFGPQLPDVNWPLRHEQQAVDFVADLKGQREEVSH